MSGVVARTAVDYDTAALPRPGGREAAGELVVCSFSPALAETLIVHLSLRDLDQPRGALKPDARGRSSRRDLATQQRHLAQEIN